MLDPEAPKEMAKATGEVAKFGTTALEFLSRISGATLEQLGGLAADQLAFWRARRRLRMQAVLEDAQAELAGRHVEATLIPDKVVIPLLEAASLEDEPDLAARWVMLLANAADRSTAATVSLRIVRILGELTADEIRVLELNYSMGLAKHSSTVYFGEEKSLFPEDVVQLMREHLAELGLAQTVVRGGGPVGGRVTLGPHITFTRTAEAFMTACHRPPTYRNPAASEDPKGR
jgi:hypothetical protein